MAKEEALEIDSLLVHGKYDAKNYVDVINKKFVPVDLERLGAVIKGLRSERGLNQAQLGELIRRTGATISNIESGKHPLDFATLKIISSALGMSYNRLLLSIQRPLYERTKEGKLLYEMVDSNLRSLELLSADESSF